MSATVYLLGLGVSPQDHASVEVLQAASRCKKLLCAGLAAADRAFLSAFAPKGAVSEAPALDKAVAALLAEAKAGRDCALVTPGHPFYYSPLGGALVAACEKAGVTWRSFGAVSPMGVGLSAVGATLGTTIHGLQSFEHASLAGKAVTPNPVWPLVVYFYEPVTKDSFAAAVKRLEGIFPAEHPVTWCSGASAGRRTSVAKLAGQAKDAGPAAVLYLPARAEASTNLGRTDVNRMEGKGKAAPTWIQE